MKENGKKREWVKTAAIIFLSVMLVLTFFSNTIMNYSLPEVATQYVQSGSITAKIRGTGTVESGDPYNVEIKDTRKVSSVAVRVGDTVAKGDVLMYLEEEESQELQIALDALETAKDAYSKALLNASITSSDIVAAQGGVSTENYRWRITQAQNAIKAEQDKLLPLEQEKAALEEWISALNKQISIEEVTYNSATEKLSVTESALKVAAEDVSTKYDAYQVAIAARENYEKRLKVAQDMAIGTVSSGDAASETMSVDELKKALIDAENKEKTAQDAYNAASSQYNTALATRNAAKTTYDESSEVQTNLKNQLSETELDLYHINNDIAKAQEAVTAKENELTELMASMNNVLNLDEYLKAIDKAQEEVDKLSADDVAYTITAPISGTISSIHVTAGESTIPDSPVVVMQPQGQGYTLSFSVTNEQARRLSVGDRADLVNAWRYDDVEVVLASIKPDKSNPGQQKMLTFNVTGEVVAGQTLNLSVGQKSANYDYIVPNSAIREDNNGKFILIVESKASPLGTRYTASRVDVQVIASDDTQSAITGAIYGYEFVITTSTAPVQAGELVRLAE